MKEIRDELEKMKDSFEKHAYDDMTHFGELKAVLDRIEKKTDAQSTILQPIAEAYSGFLFSRKFIVGVSSVVLAIGAIGAGVIWVINSAIGR